MIIFYDVTVDLAEDIYEVTVDDSGGIEADLGTVISITQVEGEPYEGEYTITPLARLDQVLPTGGKTLDLDMTVLKIPYFETSNIQGDTVYIGSEV